MIALDWIPEMRAALRDGLAAGKSMRRLADEIGVSADSIRSRAKAEGYAVPAPHRVTWTPGMLAALHRGVAEGKGIVPLAADIGVGTGTLRRRAELEGLHFPTLAERAAEKKVRLVRLVEEGASRDEIASAVSRDKQTVRRWIERMDSGILFAPHSQIRMQAAQ